jgi:hypothetical protein
MKRFTKGCLGTALVLFILGCLICTVCGVLGGFRQITAGVLNNINGIPFVCDWQEDGGFSLGFFEDDGVEDAFWERGDWQRIDTGGTKQKLAVTGAGLRQLCLEVTDCNFKIEESSDDNIWIAVNDNRCRTYYQIEKDDAGKDTLSVRNSKKHKAINWRYKPDDNISLYLPQGCDLDAITIMMGAGYMSTVPLKADVMEINVGAGVCEAKAFEAETMEVLVGAGQIEIAELKAGEADMEVGVGELIVQDIEVRNSTEMSLDVGSAEITGTLTGQVEAECNLGSLELHLTGSQEDYGFAVECELGDIEIGNHHYSGFGDSRSWNSERKNQMKLCCDLGNIKVTFQKGEDNE